MPAEAQREATMGLQRNRDRKYYLVLNICSVPQKETKEIVGGGGKEEMRNSAKLKLISPSKQFMPS